MHINATIAHSPKLSISRCISNLRYATYKSLFHKISPQTFALFCPLFLGKKGANQIEINRITNQFKQWGIVHYLARSGLHLTIFALIWIKLLRFLPLPFMLKTIILILINLIYSLLTWSSVSFMRSLLLSLCYGFCRLRKIQTHLVYHLSIVCMLILIIQPEYLFALDFQLSFLLTFALGWFNSLRIYPAYPQKKPYQQETLADTIPPE